jgi:hypothetical protein
MIYIDFNPLSLKQCYYCGTYVRQLREDKTCGCVPVIHKMQDGFVEGRKKHKQDQDITYHGIQH